MINGNDEKEEFCSLCMSGVALLSGATMTATGDRKSNKKMKKIIFWSGIVLTVISIILLIYYLRTCKECK
jgi:uncharacterized membrane protein YvbJ